MKKMIIYEKPTLKEVIFQIRFPNLFFLESKIGEFQIEIMEKFPKTQLLLPQQITLGIGNPIQINNIENSNLIGPKTWKFESLHGVSIIVSNESLSIVSKTHTLYSSGNEEENFRKLIQYVINAFYDKVARIPLILRIGLRYINIAPEIKPSTKELRSFFSTRLPLDDFNVEDMISQMSFRGIVRRKNANLIYNEKLTKESDILSFLFDFDAYENNIKASDYLSITDALHDTISEEYEKIITSKMKEKMIPKTNQDEMIQKQNIKKRKKVE